MRKENLIKHSEPGKRAKAGRRGPDRISGKSFLGLWSSQEVSIGEEISQSGFEHRRENQINLGSNSSPTTCSLDFSEPYFLICKMGTISEPTLRVEVR